MKNDTSVGRQRYTSTQRQARRRALHALREPLRPPDDDIDLLTYRGQFWSVVLRVVAEAAANAAPSGTVAVLLAFIALMFVNWAAADTVDTVSDLFEVQYAVLTPEV